MTQTPRLEVNTPELDIDIGVFNRAKVRQAVKKLKNNQAPGFDEMSAALLKADPETTTDLLVCLF